MRQDNMFDLKFKKILLLKCMHHFKSDIIKNMGHMCISGTEPSSVSQTKWFKKLSNDAQKVPKQGEAKRDSVRYPQNYNFNQFQTRNILMF